MKRLLVLLWSTAGSAIGWWLGANVGVMTAFVLSMIGLGVGIWWGARMARSVGR